MGDLGTHLLALRIHVGLRAFLIDAVDIVEVIPQVTLQSIEGGDPRLAGLLVYRGKIVPVLDWAWILESRPARDQLSTRIVLVRESRTETAERLVGLLAEQVTEIRQYPRDRVRPLSVPLARAPFVREMVVEGTEVVPIIDVPQLLTHARAGNLADSALASSASSAASSVDPWAESPVARMAMPTEVDPLDEGLLDAKPLDGEVRSE